MRPTIEVQSISEATQKVLTQPAGTYAFVVQSGTKQPFTIEVTLEGEKPKPIPEAKKRSPDEIQAFLAALTDLCREHGIFIDSYDAPDAPWLIAVNRDDAAFTRRYVARFPRLAFASIVADDLTLRSQADIDYAEEEYEDEEWIVPPP